MAHEASINAAIFPYHIVSNTNIIAAINTERLSRWAPGGLHSENETAACELVIMQPNQILASVRCSCIVVNKHTLILSIRISIQTTLWS